MGSAFNNTVQGNYIGLSGDGINKVLGAAQTIGISMSTATSNLIGGTGAGGKRNVISGNSSNGISLSAVTASANAIYQNTIGPNTPAPVPCSVGAVPNQVSPSQVLNPIP